MLAHALTHVPFSRQLAASCEHEMQAPCRCAARCSLLGCNSLRNLPPTRCRNKGADLERHHRILRPALVGQQRLGRWTPAPSWRIQLIGRPLLGQHSSGCWRRICWSTTKRKCTKARPSAEPRRRHGPALRARAPAVTALENPWGVPSCARCSRKQSERMRPQPTCDTL
jgi:hypothetical protein